MNILKNPLFWLPVLVAALVAGFFYSKNKNISSPKNEEFVQISNIDDSSIDITLFGMENGQATFQGDLSIAQASSVLKSTADQINADIFELLQNSNDKQSTLNGFLSLAQANITDSKQLSEGLKSKHQALQKNFTQCQQQKSQYDKDFFNGIKTNDQNLISSGLEGSKKSGACSTENKIEANAYKIILDNLTNSSKLLEQKYNLLNKNKALIVENFELFKANNLEQLLQVKNSFKNLNSSTPSQANNFGIQFPNIF